MYIHHTLAIHLYIPMDFQGFLCIAYLLLGHVTSWHGAGCRQAWKSASLTDQMPSVPITTSFLSSLPKQNPQHINILALTLDSMDMKKQVFIGHLCMSHSVFLHLPGARSARTISFKQSNQVASSCVHSEIWFKCITMCVIKLTRSLDGNPSQQLGCYSLTGSHLTKTG